MFNHGNVDFNGSLPPAILAEEKIHKVVTQKIPEAGSHQKLPVIGGKAADIILDLFLGETGDEIQGHESPSVQGKEKEKMLGEVGATMFTRK